MKLTLRPQANKNTVITILSEDLIEYNKVLTNQAEIDDGLLQDPAILVPPVYTEPLDFSDITAGGSASGESPVIGTVSRDVNGELLVSLLWQYDPNSTAYDGRALFSLTVAEFPYTVNIGDFMNQVEHH